MVKRTKSKGLPSPLRGASQLRPRGKEPTLLTGQESGTASHQPPGSKNESDVSDGGRLEPLVHGGALPLPRKSDVRMIDQGQRRALEARQVDLNTLVIFAKVVEAKSFSEGARRLRLPLSTVSRRIGDLEAQLGVRLLERSTRKFRLTPVGAELLEHAQRTAELRDVVASVVSYQTSTVVGTLRLSAPPSISETLLAPIVGTFQEQYPRVRVQILVTERMVDHISEGIDLVFRLGVQQKDSSLIAQKLLTYRHRLVASPAYLDRVTAPQSPDDLLEHRLLAFSHLKPDRTWNFVKVDGSERVAVHFQPYLSMNDFAGLAAALLAGVGIGDLPPIVRPELVREGKLVEVMPGWRFSTFILSLLQASNRQSPRHVTLFKRLAMQMAPRLFPDLPT